MSEQNAVQDGKQQKKDARKAAFSDHLEEMEDALNVLFIRNNASGRNKFRDKWPELALYLFGSELIDFDDNGTDDRARRSELEEAADRRRIELKAAAMEIPEKSVRSGMLEFEYVGTVIDKFGSVISKYLYSEEVIERVRPGLLSAASQASDLLKNETDSTDNDVTDSNPLQREQEKEILKNAPVDSMEEVRPIETPEIPPAQQAVHSPSKTEENDDFSIPQTITESENTLPEEPPMQQEAIKEELHPSPQPSEILQSPAVQEAVSTPSAPKESNDFSIPETIAEAENNSSQEPAPQDQVVPSTTPIQTEPPLSQQQPASEQPPVNAAPSVTKGTYVSIFNACAMKTAA